MFLGFCLEEEVKFEWSILRVFLLRLHLTGRRSDVFNHVRLKVHRAPKSVISKPDLLYLAGPRSAEGDAAGLYGVCVCMCVTQNREYIYGM